MLSGTRSFVVTARTPSEAPHLDWIGNKVAVVGAPERELKLEMLNLGTALSNPLAKLWVVPQPRAEELFLSVRFERRRAVNSLKRLAGIASSGNGRAALPRLRGIHIVKCQTPERVQGLNNDTPNGSKSVLFRVTSVIPHSSAVAAIRPSANDVGRPD